MSKQRIRRPGPHRTDSEREEHLVAISKWVRKGKTQQYMADQLGVSRSQIVHDITTLKGRWRKANTTLIAEYTGRMLDSLDEAEAEAWAAWERSKEEAIRTRSERTDDLVDEREGDDGVVKIVTVKGKQKAVVDRRGRDGEVDFLNAVVAVANARMKLLGIGKDVVAGEVADADLGPMVPARNLKANLHLVEKAAAGLDRVRARAARLAGASEGEFRELPKTEGGSQ